MLTLRPWTAADLAVLDRTIGNPQMMTYLGGPESPDALVRRHERYLALASSGAGEMFTIAFGPDFDTAGTTGYWQREWNGTDVYETGWQVFTEFAGRGIATQAALAIVSLLRKKSARRFLHAYPSIENIASNRVCEKAGFEKIGEVRGEYPKGRFMTVSDWRYDLEAGRTGPDFPKA